MQEFLKKLVKKEEISQKGSKARRTNLRPKACPERVLQGPLCTGVQGLSPVQRLGRKVTSKDAWGVAAVLHLGSRTPPTEDSECARDRGPPPG